VQSQLHNFAIQQTLQVSNAADFAVFQHSGNMRSICKPLSRNAGALQDVLLQLLLLLPLLQLLLAVTL
jgi:hypothetical protein